MFEINGWTLREKVMAGVIIVLAILLLGVWGFQDVNGQDEEKMPIIESFELEKKEKEPIKTLDRPINVVIEVKGAVKHPGVYQLVQGARVIDALKKAGGVQATADLNVVNQAFPLSDGMVIYVPHQGENWEQIPVFQGYLPSPRTSSWHPSSDKSDKIRINQATVKELEQLNGIGEAKARAIWEYRQEHGPFRSLEELAKVPGIGEKTVQKFQDQIVLD